MTDLLKKLKKTSEVTTVSPTPARPEVIVPPAPVPATDIEARPPESEPMDPPPPPPDPMQPEVITIGKATVAKADCIYVEMADSGSIAGYKFKRGERLWVPKDALSGLAGKYVLVKKP